jgi:hypothetical protein
MEGISHGQRTAGNRARVPFFPLKAQGGPAPLPPRYMRLSCAGHCPIPGQLRLHGHRLPPLPPISSSQWERDVLRG